MARLFISYSHEDRDKAEKLAKALTERDHIVWWDREIGTGDAFRRTIERELKECEGAIVLWSAASAGSRWVLDEADFAVRDEKLLPVTFEPDVEAPIGFGQFHVVDFSTWSGDSKALVLEELDKKITEVLHGNFRAAVLEIGRRAGQGRGSKTAAMLVSSIGSNVGGLPVLRLAAGAAYAAFGLAALQAAVAFVSGQLSLDYVIAGIGYWILFMILRAAHQPVALGIGGGRRFFDEAFTFWMLFAALIALLFFGLLSLGGPIDAMIICNNAPIVAFLVLAGIVLGRLFLIGMSFLFRRV